ncbi:calcium-binding protein [Hyalangium sp.]|uniref:EF-hand domain-containing protein n=1 Tax=Hyalangium sp. TaxID=2028555 RepID=UPI002D64A1E3|nr:calcium-binding protein [Hyalangium sp.]HYI00672.1 calcium-binding protein [Hyalangium sp.]
MKRPSPRRLLTAALWLTLPLGTVACNAAMTDQELALGEAASYVVASEESGDIGGDAVADADAAALDSFTTEAVDTVTVAPVDDGSPCDFSARRQQVLEKYDDNQNGQLDRAELRELRADIGEGGPARQRLAQLGRRARHQAFWRVRWAFDEDGSRSLSTEERSALVDAMEARCERLRAERLEQYDANGDGQLDEAERQAARDAVRAKWEQKRQELLTKYDANGNGVLDSQEREQIRLDWQAKAQERRAALLAQYDTNGDGSLSTAEALPLRQEIQRRIIEGHDAG